LLQHNQRLLSPPGIVAPLFRGIQAAIQENVPLGARITQKGANLTGLDPARRARVLAFDTYQAVTLSDEAALVRDATPVFVAEELNDVLQQAIPVGISLPLHPVQQPLRGIRDAVTDGFSHLPAILALHRSQQSTQVLSGPSHAGPCGQKGSAKRAQKLKKSAPYSSRSKKMLSPVAECGTPITMSASITPIRLATTQPDTRRDCPR